jgi:hypothetical protein
VIADVAAHVLRLDHAPVTAALARAAVLIPADAAIAHYADVAFLRTCPLCSGSRECPDCGGPCEVCTVQPQ